MKIMKGAHCTNCGQEVFVEADFCPNCGQEVKDLALEMHVKITQRFPDSMQQVVEKALPLRTTNFRGEVFYKGKWQTATPDGNGQPCITVDAPLSDKKSSGGCASMFLLTFVLFALLLSGISLTSCKPSVKALEAPIAGATMYLPSNAFSVTLKEACGNWTYLGQ